MTGSRHFAGIRACARPAIALLALTGLAGSAAAAELVLPSPAAPTAARAASYRVEATPRADGALDARVTLALTGGSAGERVALALPALPLVAVDVGGAEVPPPADGRLDVDLGAGEALLVRFTWRLEPDVLDWLPATEAAWIGRTRGPLLAPAVRVVVRHPEGSAFASAPVSARIAPGEIPLSSLLQSPPGRLARGEASWEGVVVQPPQRLVLAWPLSADELLPRDRAEAEALAEDLLQRDVPGVEYERLRDAVAASGEPGAAAAAGVLSSLASERARRIEAAEREKKRRDEEEARRVAARQAQEREKESAEAAARAAREQADREGKARAAQEQADREAAARQAQEQADREAAARQAQEQADREAAARQAQQQADRESAARQAQEQADREAAARQAQEQADREAAARQAQEQADREAARQAQEQADRESAARQAQEQADREAAARRAAQAPPTPERREQLESAAAEVQERERREQLARTMAASRPQVVPWIRSADAAREFLSARDGSAPPDRARIEEAIATVRAHWGEPFKYERRWRERFSQEPWYAPRREDALLPATEGEIAALEILAQALD